jgi:hypothetical protein
VAAAVRHKRIKPYYLFPLILGFIYGHALLFSSGMTNVSPRSLFHRDGLQRTVHLLHVDPWETAKSVWHTHHLHVTLAEITGYLMGVAALGLIFKIKEYKNSSADRLAMAQAYLALDQGELAEKVCEQVEEKDRNNLWWDLMTSLHLWREDAAGAEECARNVQRTIRWNFMEDDVFRTMWNCLADMARSKKRFEAFARRLPTSGCTTLSLRFYVTQLRDLIGAEAVYQALGEEFMRKHPEIKQPY